VCVLTCILGQKANLAKTRTSLLYGPISTLRNSALSSQIWPRRGFPPASLFPHALSTYRAPRSAQHHASPAAKMATTVASLRVVAPASVASKRGGMLRTRTPGTSRRYTHRAVHIRVDRATTTWLVGRGRGRLPSSSFPVSLAGYHPTSGSMRHVPAVRCVYINTRGCCTPNTR
jgi:hypothetical protein